VLERNRFAIQEHKKIFSAVQSYDIRDAETGDVIGSARETIGGFTQALRWMVSKHILPTRVEVREKPDDSLLFTLHRKGYIFRSRVEVRDSMDSLVGWFKSKFFTVSGGFHVYDKDAKHFAHVQGRMFGFDYRFLTEDDRVELGRVSKKIEGIGGIAREMFFSADHYYLEVNQELTKQPFAKMLLLAATLAIDLIYKSDSRE
jgi:hypothetical protein